MIDCFRIEAVWKYFIVAEHRNACALFIIIDIAKRYIPYTCTTLHMIQIHLRARSIFYGCTLQFQKNIQTIFFQILLNICIIKINLVEMWLEIKSIHKSRVSGADPGILVRGGVDFFFKGMGFGARLKAPSGSRATPWWVPRGWSPRKLLNFSDFRSKI